MDPIDLSMSTAFALKLLIREVPASNSETRTYHPMSILRRKKYLLSELQSVSTCFTGINGQYLYVASNFTNSSLQQITWCYVYVLLMVLFAEDVANAKEGSCKSEDL